MSVKDNMNMSLGDEEIIMRDEFIQETLLQTQNTSCVDDIEIKYEEANLNFPDSTSEPEPEDKSKSNMMSNIPHVDCGSDKLEQMDLNEFCLELLQCARDCETCQTYISILSKHVRATHAPPQRIEDPLHVDLLNIDLDPSQTDQSSSSNHISEVREGIVKMECTDLIEESVPNFDFDPDYDIEITENDSVRDPDYVPLPFVIPKLRPQRQGSVKVRPSSKPKKNNSKKEVLPSREHFKCKECNKSFQSMMYLKVHMRIHDRGRPNKCDVCESCFSSEKSLTEHKKIHTGEKSQRHVCSVCEKCFTAMSALTRHKMIHTGEKPHKCDECEKSFSRSSDLTVHKRSHTGEKPYLCTECERSFTTSSALTVHTMNAHTRERPHKCDECKKSYTRRDHLIQHKKGHRVRKRKNVRV